MPVAEFLEVKAFGGSAAIAISPDKERKGWFLQAASKKNSEFDWPNGITMGLSPTEGLALAALMAGHTNVLWDMNSGNSTGLFHKPHGSNTMRKVMGSIHGTHVRIRVQENKNGIARHVDVSVCPKHRVDIAIFLFTVSTQIEGFKAMQYSDIQGFSKSFFPSLAQKD